MPHAYASWSLNHAHLINIRARAEPTDCWLASLTPNNSRSIQHDHRRYNEGGGVTLHATIHYPVTTELYVNGMLNRHEVRRLCDSCGTGSEMVRHLSASVDPAYSD